jgi:hypothetical protein
MLNLTVEIRQFHSERLLANDWKRRYQAEQIEGEQQSWSGRFAVPAIPVGSP